MVSEWYLNGFLMIFWILCTIQWYLKLPLRVPLSPAEISLNGPMVLNGIQWYSMVYHWHFFVRVDLSHYCPKQGWVQIHISQIKFKYRWLSAQTHCFSIFQLRVYVRACVRVCYIKYTFYGKLWYKIETFIMV